MSYTALYRKFRPTSFDEVRGQDHIIRTLKNQIESGRTGHAYLFCGTRGTGKTSVAKILAKTVNCEKPENGAPCGICSMCREIADGATMNIIEIDAASNNGVDNIRQVIDEVAYPPTKGQYKVYIIDEVHMLSIGAFNALLKTLEEPPSYVMFILATTEAHKVPITIMSRCQRYDFKRITRNEISEHLKKLAETEGLQYEDRALEYVAKQADGSMRDALSLLDQCIAFNFGNILTYEKVLEVLGTVDTGVMYSLVDAIFKSDCSRAIKIIEDVVLFGKELSQFVMDFTWYLRNLMLIGISDEMEEVLDASAESLADMKSQAKGIGTQFLMRCINRLSELTAVLKNTTHKRVMTEVYIIRLCKPEMEEDLTGVNDRLRLLETKMEGQTYNLSQNINPAAYHTEEPVQRTVEDRAFIQTQAKPDINKPVFTENTPEPVVVTADNVKTVEASDIEKLWPKIIACFKGSDKAMLEEAKASSDAEGNLVLLYPKSADFSCNYVQSFGLLDRITETIKKRFGMNVSCKATIINETNNFNNNISKLRQLVNVPIEEES